MKLKDFTGPYQELQDYEKKNFFFISFSLFFVLFSYPLVRSTTTALFIQEYGAKKSPLVWLYSVITLSIVIFIYNWAQRKIGNRWIFNLTNIFSAAFLLLGLLALKQGMNFAVYGLFIWKEVYIVLLVHLILGHFNTHYKYEFAKVGYGPLGAIGSVGGIFGGLLSSALTHGHDLSVIALYGIGLFSLSMLPFNSIFRVKVDETKNEIPEKKERPLEAIGDMKKYVFLIAMLVVLSQFCINIINLKFNFILETYAQTKELKSRYLSNIYTIINGLSLLIQFILTPFLLKAMALRNIHYSVTGVYIVLIPFFTFFFSPIIAIAGFALVKSIDYSLFGTIKEMLYYGLDKQEKYGAKYIIDMVVYRLSKGVISLLLIFVQAPLILNTLLIVFTLLWCSTVYKVFNWRNNHIDLKNV